MIWLALWLVCSLVVSFVPLGAVFYATKLRDDRDR